MKRYPNSVITVRNIRQLALFESELKGQLSDGNWENSRPYDHWEQPCSSEVVVGEGPKYGPNFYPKRSYNFANRDLVEVVGDRMIRAVRFALLGYPMQEIRHGLDDLSESDFTYTGEYWDKKRARFAVLGIKSMDDYNRILATAPAYTKSDLLKDLKQMSKDYNAARKPSYRNL